MLILLTTIIFTSRNINRIIKEVKIYNYKPFKQTNYFLDDSHFRIQKHDGSNNRTSTTSAKHQILNATLM